MISTEKKKNKITWLSTCVVENEKLFPHKSSPEKRSRDGEQREKNFETLQEGLQDRLKYIQTTKLTSNSVQYAHLGRRYKTEKLVKINANFTTICVKV